MVCGDHSAVSTMNASAMGLTVISGSFQWTVYNLLKIKHIINLEWYTILWDLWLDRPWLGNSVLGGKDRYPSDVLGWWMGQCGGPRWLYFQIWWWKWMLEGWAPLGLCTKSRVIGLLTRELRAPKRACAQRLRQKLCNFLAPNLRCPRMSLSLHSAGPVSLSGQPGFQKMEIRFHLPIKGVTENMWGSWTQGLRFCSNGCLFTHTQL